MRSSRAPQPSRRKLTLYYFRSAFKSSSNSSATDSLLSERGHIDNSHRMADETLKCVFPLDPHIVQNSS